MPATFVVVPQWQGSVSSRAMSHADGAAAILGDLPAAATIVVEVPVEAGDALGTGVARYSALRRVRERTEDALAQVPDLALTVGGDCGTSLGAVAHASRRSGGDLAVLWLDAHPDLNTPESSPSGGFGGMTLRAIAGRGRRGARARRRDAGPAVADRARRHPSHRRRGAPVHRRARRLRAHRRGPLRPDDGHRRTRGHRRIAGLRARRPRRARPIGPGRALVPDAVRRRLRRARHAAPRRRRTLPAGGRHHRRIRTELPRDGRRRPSHDPPTRRRPHVGERLGARGRGDAASATRTE